MNTYILLRDNKESASLTLEGLKQMGLKPNDLVWVECQSVCWQYPHEIPSLKSLVAVNAGASIALQQPATTLPEPEILLGNADYSPGTIPDEEKKLVFVELPAGIKKTDNKKLPVAATISAADINKYGGLQASDKLEEDQTVNTTINYSRPLDEIKEMDVKNLQQQKKPNGITINLPAPVRKIAIYAGLVLGGALLTLFITRTAKRKSIAIAPVTTNKPVTANTSTEQLVDQPVIPEQTTTPDQTEQTTIAVKEPATTIVAKKPVPKETVAEEPIAIDTKEEIIEKKKTAPTEIPTQATPEEDIASQLVLRSNKYEVGSFGGIRNLEMTLQNDSKYLLDKVTAELQYLNPEGTVIKTETIYFQSVAPAAKETVSVKKTTRGVKIKYSVRKIESKQLNDATAGL